MTMESGRPTAEQRARQRVEHKLGLVVHWLVYLTVNTGLIIATGGFAGSGWRLAGWGLGLAVHTAYVVADLGRLQQRLVQRELARERVR
jgi:hypothetical protein